jgi:hypothetical protein
MGKQPPNHSEAKMQRPPADSRRLGKADTAGVTPHAPAAQKGTGQRSMGARDDNGAGSRGRGNRRGRRDDGY